MISCYVSYVAHYGLGNYDDDFVLDRTFYLDTMATEAYQGIEEILITVKGAK
jgi:hypothetical protein